MSYEVIERNNRTYIACGADAEPIRSEFEALDWVGICGGHETNRLLLQACHLTEDFYNLRSGLAGAILLKFSIYSLKVAAVLTPELVGQGRFWEMVIETNRGNAFRVFYEQEQAEEWLTAS